VCMGTAGAPGTTAALVPPLPLMARVVDRGALSGPSDVAAFEMFGTPVRGLPPPYHMICFYRVDY
jgi:hypothetical protein